MQNDKPKGIAREAQRQQLTGVPTSTWYDLQNAGLAPKPIHLGPRTVGWLISELEEWVESRRRERDTGSGWQKLGDAAAKVVDKASGQAG
jgi:prophage regulatory protein